MRVMIADEPALGIFIFILLEIQHQITPAPLGWNTFPRPIKEGAIILADVSKSSPEPTQECGPGGGLGDPVGAGRARRGSHGW